MDEWIEKHKTTLLAREIAFEVEKLRRQNNEERITHILYVFGIASFSFVFFALISRWIG
jgi:hypothetical protein